MVAHTGIVLIRFTSDWGCLEIIMRLIEQINTKLK